MSYKKIWASKYKSIRHLKELFRIKNKSEGTVDQYIIGIKQFLDFLKQQNPDQFLKDVKEGHIDFNEKVREFVSFQLDRGLNSRTLRHYVVSVESWLQLNDVEVKVKDKYMPEGTNKRRLMDRSPKRDELKLLLDHAKTRDKAILEVASSSGLRMGTLLTLQLGDVDFTIDDKIALINVNGGPGRKLNIGKSYFTFITPEARLRLEQYLDERKRSQTLTPKSPLFSVHFDVRNKSIAKPVNRHTFKTQWVRLLEKANLLEMDSTGLKTRYILHFHTLRKYFKTQCENAGVKSTFIEFFMGHTHGLDDSYFKPSVKEGLEEYQKAIQHLSIEEYEAAGIRGEVKDLAYSKHEQDKRIEDLESELLELRTELAYFKLQDKITGKITDTVMQYLANPEKLPKGARIELPTKTEIQKDIERVEDLVQKWEKKRKKRLNLKS